MTWIEWYDSLVKPLDARPGDHQPHLDDPLPGHCRQLRLRLLKSPGRSCPGGWRRRFAGIAVLVGLVGH